MIRTWEIQITETLWYIPTCVWTIRLSHFLFDSVVFAVKLYKASINYTDISKS